MGVGDYLQGSPKTAKFGPDLMRGGGPGDGEIYGSCDFFIFYFFFIFSRDRDLEKPVDRFP
ncbi:MAG TPA: hypothetical protein VIJ25_16175, partial [Methylococcales bacterium]